ncbi:MAG: hypothetical protein K6G06_05600 [Butyrivibrio sp.]|nr:hypothetical protein [Butyrivibrio sp.]
MKKLLTKALTMLLVFMVVFTAVGTTASAANLDKKAKSICKFYQKAGNKAKGLTGPVKVKYKKEGKVYHFTFTLNLKQDASIFGMTKSFAPKEYNQARKSIVKNTTKFRKKIKKKGIKKNSVTYIVNAGGKQLWVATDGQLIYDRYE